MKIVLGTPVIGARPRPWIELNLPIPILVNSFNLIKRRPSPGDAPLHSLMQHEGEVWLDSGGYQFLKRGIEIGVDDIVDIYSRYWDAQAYLSLDYPPSPLDSREEAWLKMRRSLANYVELSKRLPGFNIVPVIHFYRDVNLSMDMLKMALDHGPSMIAIGALVPYILMTHNVPKNSRRMALEFIMRVKENHPKVHVLGLGSPIITPILRALELHSTDTATWRLKAVYGKVMMPGGGERHVTGRDIKFGKKEATLNDINELYGFLKSTGFPMLDDFWAKLDNFEYRALINAWVVLMSNKPPSHGVFSIMYRELMETLQGKQLPNA